MSKTSFQAKRRMQLPNSLTVEHSTREHSNHFRSPDKAITDPAELVTAEESFLATFAVRVILS